MQIIKKYLSLIVLLISIVTILSGLTQVFAPGFVLGVIGAEVNQTSAHFFGIVGMFMALFGALMIHNMYAVHTSPIAVFWCGMQKLGAFVAVSLGVFNGVFSVLAMGVAIFDLVSAGIFFFYIKMIKEQ
jgi:hypothetical protein